ncbi:TPA: hypothetical protein ACKFSY_004090, partial [Clostridioides difficile]
SLTIVPAKSDIAKIAEQTTLIIIFEYKGTLTLFTPYPKLVTKASIQREVTNKIDSITVD